MHAWGILITEYLRQTIRLSRFQLINISFTVIGILLFL